MQFLMESSDEEEREGKRRALTSINDLTGKKQKKNSKTL